MSSGPIQKSHLGEQNEFDKLLDQASVHIHCKHFHFSKQNGRCHQNYQVHQVQGTTPQAHKPTRNYFLSEMDEEVLFQRQQRCVQIILRHRKGFFAQNWYHFLK